MYQECNFVFTTEIGVTRNRRFGRLGDDLETLNLTCTKLEVCWAFENRDWERDLGVMCIEVGFGGLKSPEKSRVLGERGGKTSLRRND